MRHIFKFLVYALTNHVLIPSRLVQQILWTNCSFTEKKNAKIQMEKIARSFIYMNHIVSSVLFCTNCFSICSLFLLCIINYYFLFSPYSFTHQKYVIYSYLQFSKWSKKKNRKLPAAYKKKMPTFDSNLFVI